MTNYIGTHSAKVDDKGRLILPSQLKNQSSETLRFVVKRSFLGDCLDIYPYDEWEQEANVIKSKLNFFKPEHIRFWREYMNDRAIIEPDGKLGRISIPKALLESIGITKEVIFFGVGFKIELWDKERFQSSKLDDRTYSEIASTILF